MCELERRKLSKFTPAIRPKLDKNLMDCDALALLKIINKLPRNDLITLAEVNKRLKEHAEYSFRLHHRNFNLASVGRPWRLTKLSDSRWTRHQPAGQIHQNDRIVVEIHAQFVNNRHCPCSPFLILKNPRQINFTRTLVYQPLTFICWQNCCKINFRGLMSSRKQ